MKGKRQKRNDDDAFWFPSTFYLFFFYGPIKSQSLRTTATHCILSSLKPRVAEMLPKGTQERLINLLRNLNTDSAHTLLVRKTGIPYSTK